MLFFCNDDYLLLIIVYVCECNNIIVYFQNFLNIVEKLTYNEKLNNIAELYNNIASASRIPHRNYSNIFNYCHNIVKYCYIIAVILLNGTTVFQRY